MRFHNDVLQMLRGSVAALGLAALSGFAGPAVAQEVTGELGSPGATTTIDGKQLPPPDPAFGGVIKEKASESTALVGAARRAAEGRAQRAADHDGRSGLRRAGHIRRRHPDAGHGSHRQQRPALHEFPLHLALLADARGADHRPQPSLGRLRRGRRNGDGFPGYDSIIPNENGTIGTILRDNGYATSWFGKNHNTPFYQASQAGPFDQWPNGMGFEYFYGFVGGDASQWQPNLFRNTTAIYPFEGNPGWNLETAMADEAIQHMKQLKEIAPDKPCSSITCRAAPMRRTIRRRNGSRRSATCTCSTTAGTSCARRSSPTRSGSASCPRTPS